MPPLALLIPRPSPSPTPCGWLIGHKGGVLGGFPSIPGFEDAVDGYLAQITSSSGDVGFAIPAYLASRPLPDHWDHVQNMSLKFEGFRYQTVQVHSVPVSYLFITFSVQSFGVPPPCYCEDEPFAPLGNFKPVTADDSPVPKNGKHKWAQLDLPDYWRFLAAAQISAFGLSEQRFHEIARPYASPSHIQSTSTGGTIYSSVRLWYTTSLVETQITLDGVNATLDATGEESAKAAVRDICGHNVLSASARLRIAIHRSSVVFTWNMFEKAETNPPEIRIEAIFVPTLGDIDVEFSTPFDPPPPLNEIKK
ncbi:hypothetical protein PV08_01165 [Exophiala spinifera]|uniref:Uncharacterized protein n=1 Tax=Exophiala spinifera TaxID=91928 RepID=A0A0D2BQ12_9EURO|nr:uncharacterized protein PV08_01165 [Exophiala spinifera]KIW20590.1 hypothetical protein PV08_01165 [Exophiala spinifera]